MTVPRFIQAASHRAFETRVLHGAARHVVKVVGVIWVFAIWRESMGVPEARKPEARGFLAAHSVA